MTEDWQRHDLLRIDPRGWRYALSSRPDLTALQALAGWAQNGWPVMVRRYVANDAPDLIPIAVALPRCSGRSGVMLQVRPQDVMTRLAAVPLSEAACSAPASWSATLQRLGGIGVCFGIEPAVFGSLLWQRLTGLSYLRERSDLDLIWRVSESAQALALADAIQSCAAASPMAIDGEFILPNGGAVHWRELHQQRAESLVKTLRGVQSIARQRLFQQRSCAGAACLDAEAIGALAAKALLLEIETSPKPGLVSPIDSGSHADMNAPLLRRSVEALRPHFVQLAHAGAMQADLQRLRRIGMTAEEAMLRATGGVNTHRGAIFGLGLLCAAAGYAGRAGSHHDTGSSPSLGTIVREQWGAVIGAPARADRSHGARARRRYGAGGARAQAAGGFMHVYQIGWPALRHGRQLADGDENAARVHCCFGLLAALTDTNLLHRGGLSGLWFARERAQAFLRGGGVGRADWRDQALHVHRQLVARHLSPGGCADLLAMTLFVDAHHSAAQTRCTHHGLKAVLV